MFIMCNNLEVFVYVSIGVKNCFFVVVVLFCGERRGCVHRAHFWFIGPVSDVRLKLNVLVVGMMGGGGGAVPPVSRSTACADPGIFVGGGGGPAQLKFEYSSVLKRVCLVAGILKLIHALGMLSLGPTFVGVRQQCVSEQAGLNLAGSPISVFTRQCYISQRIRTQYKLSR